MKKINVNTKGYTLEFCQESKNDHKQVTVKIPKRSRNDRMTYWTPKELISLIETNFGDLGKITQVPNDLCYSLDNDINVITIEFKIKAKISTSKTTDAVVLTTGKDTKTFTPSRTSRKKTKK